MLLKETGFRPLYHNICAFALNDSLRNLVKNCPEADKASHAVFYGYIDPKKGLLLELLGVGKQAKYFYFREPYEGRKVTVPASSLQDVEFICFNQLEPRFRKKYEPRISKLKKFAASEEMEEARAFTLVDNNRMLGHPDIISVILLKKEGDPEPILVYFHAVGEEWLEGIVIEPASSGYGPKAGDPLAFKLMDSEEGKTICVAFVDEEEAPAAATAIDTVAATGGDVLEKPDSKGLALTLNARGFFNYALYENNIELIKSIELHNTTGNTAEDLALKISADFPFFKDCIVKLPPIPSGKPIGLESPKLLINGSQLMALTESVKTNVKIDLCQGEEILYQHIHAVEVLAYDKWHGGEEHIDLLAAFVMPNHPVIPMLMQEAVERLKKWRLPSSLEGYQGCAGNPNRVRELAAAMYAAVQKQNINYANPPASFYSFGQRIRTPDMVMEQKFGTCMDMTLLYAACLEAIGLHCLLVLIRGHIFAGLWLRERSFNEIKSSSIVITDINELRKRFNNGNDELTFVECTAMCADSTCSFAEAEERAKDHLRIAEDFERAIDIERARLNIKPIPSRVKDSSSYGLKTTQKSEEGITAPPEPVRLTVVGNASPQQRKPMTKKQLWESKLLDLSERNMLLSLPNSSAVQPIMSSNIDELEDALADGREFHLQPLPEWLEGFYIAVNDENGREMKLPWVLYQQKTRGAFELTDWPVVPEIDVNEKIRQEYRNHRLYTYCKSKQQLERELTTMYRAARASQQENGVSSLYLAIGLLRWIPDEETNKPSYAPLILLPIEIIRKSANQGYALHARDEEAHFNTTLLEMLKQKYNITIPGLDPLPMDSHGVDINKVFALVRGAVYSMSYWDVVPSCAIANFSFTQFAMWNDIHTAGQCLENNKVVNSLMKGTKTWQERDFDNKEADHAYLPITADGSQLKAVQMAAKGKTFILHGPPGTGKSQTITAMIANLMAQGKTVLFVAEKMAALAVVEKRLSNLGIGDFCLELHSDKANKKQVLGQLEKALAIKHPSKKTNYSELLRKVQNSKGQLDKYAHNLHAERKCGYSLRQLVDLYEEVRDNEEMVSFTKEQLARLTYGDIKNHLAHMGQLRAAGEAVEGLLGSPLLSVGLTSYGAEVRAGLAPAAAAYLQALENIEESGNAVAKVFATELAGSKEQLAQLNSLIGIYKANKEQAALCLDLLEAGCQEAYGYFQQEQLVKQQEEGLLQLWKKEFLAHPMAGYLNRHREAGKKIFFKGGAMAAVTAEVQQYAHVQVTYEHIPFMLSQISAYQERLQSLEEHWAGLSEKTKALIKMLPTREAYENAYLKAQEAQQQAQDLPGGLRGVLLLSQEGRDHLFATFQNHVAAVLTAEEGLNKLLCRREPVSATWLKDEKAFCRYLLDHPGTLKEWSLYNQARQEAYKSGLSPVVEAFEGKTIKGNMVNAYRKGLYYGLINEILNTDDALSSFSGSTFNEAIQQFKKLDDALLEYTKEEIYYLLASGIPAEWNGGQFGEELNLLRKAIGSNGRGMSIRSLFEKIAHVLPKLTPCMLMSPDSVAQYLAQKNNLFDVVIFDEASQIPTCKAIGALYRGKDAIIVGDPKQMPPTLLFTGSKPQVDDLAMDDLDSILDDALALGLSSQYLQWHYRSQHESLIAFSNSHFYDNKMYTFPSANDRERHVKVVPVEGLYHNSTNVKEAEAIVAEIISRFHDPLRSKESIGVVTFNGKQQILIENLLAKQFQKDPQLDLWANSGTDPVFVKNIENVQGDERDAILFSVCYGPDEKGRVSMNFGPINRAGGGKRLNVAFSRARMSMTIFSSISSLDLKITENSSEGLVAFRDFLRYAEGHNIYPGVKAQGNSGDAREGILASICSLIENQGLECEIMVGHSDFRVDIAVVNPYDNTKYILGIMLDGEGYKRAANTRDREIAQLGVLQNLGWQLHRIWTIDWWDNRQKVERLLLQKLAEVKALAEQEKGSKGAQAAEVDREQLLAELRQQAEEVLAEAEAEAEAPTENTEVAVEVNTPAKDTEVVAEANTPTENTEVAVEVSTTAEHTEVAAEVSTGAPVFTLVDYEEAKLEELKLTAAEFIAPANKALLTERIGQILEAEAPILKEALIRKLLSSCGVNRNATALEAAEKLIKGAKVKNTKVKGEVFCWQQKQDPKTYGVISVSNSRSAEEIPPQEVKNAACYVLQTKESLDKDALVKEISLVFGYKRLGKNLEAVITAGLQYAKANGFLAIGSGKKFILAKE